MPTARKPSGIEAFTDQYLPRLWSNWKENGKPHALKRPLTVYERTALDARVADLEIPCGPYAPAERAAVAAAVANMFASFRSMKQHDDADAAVLVRDIVDKPLKQFPLWAIEEGCTRIRQGVALDDQGERLDKKFAPNDAEIVSVISQILFPYQKALNSARALLAAPVER